MITRIHKLITKEGISIRKFEQSIHASNGLIRKAITNHTDVQSKWILEIANTYSNLNLDWLITGKGEMYRRENGTEQTTKFTEIKELELRVKVESLKSVVESNKALIETQAETIRTKNEIIEMKDNVISAFLEKERSI